MEENIKILEDYLERFEEVPYKILKSDEIKKCIEWKEIQALKKLLQSYKQDEKIIDLMAQAIDNYDAQLVINTFKNKEDVKEFFREKVEMSKTIREPIHIQTADEMFEKLRYKKTFTQLADIKFYKDDDNVIYFKISQKTFIKSGEYDGMCDSITMQELQAINKKCKELGWI